VWCVGRIVTGEAVSILIITKRILLRLAEKAQYRLASERDVRDVFRRKPSGKLLIGLSMMGMSYVTCWPVITVLGGAAAKYHDPLVFSIGSPIAYAFSHLLFLAGTFVAGAEGVMYSRVFIQWCTYNVCKRMLGEDPRPSNTGLDPMSADSNPTEWQSTEPSTEKQA